MARSVLLSKPLQSSAPLHSEGHLIRHIVAEIGLLLIDSSLRLIVFLPLLLLSFFLLRAIEKLELCIEALHDQLCRISIVAALVLPFARLDFALHKNAANEEYP